MKRIVYIVVMGLLSQGIVVAQTNTIRVKGGALDNKMIPFTDRYRYDQFRSGKILFLDGTSAMALFNYNVLLGEVQFIDSHGDTLAVADQPPVRLVGIGGELFWHDPRTGYLEVIDEYGAVKLAVKYGLKLAKNDKLTAFGQSSGTSAITNYQFYSSDNASVRKFDPKGDLILIKDKIYFIIDQNGRSLPINKTSLLKVFGKHREQVSAYLRTESVDFDQENDLKKLLTYCSQLL